MIYGDPIILGGGGSSGGPDKVMTRGQVSNTSTYMTATFDSSVDLPSYDFVEVQLYRAGVMVGGNAIRVPASSDTFTIIGGGYTYTMDLTPTTIRCSDYAGNYVNLFVDVFAYHWASE